MREGVDQLGREKQDHPSQISELPQSCHVTALIYFTLCNSTHFYFLSSLTEEKLFILKLY